MGDERDNVHDLGGAADKPRRVADPTRLEAAAKKQKVRRELEKLKAAKSEEELIAMMAQRLDRPAPAATAPAATPTAPAKPSGSELAQGTFGVTIPQALALMWDQIGTELKGTPYEIDKPVTITHGTKKEKQADGSEKDVPNVITFSKRDVLVETEAPLAEKYAAWLLGTPEGLALGGLILCFGVPAVQTVRANLAKKQAEKEGAKKPAPIATEKKP